VSTTQSRPSGAPPRSRESRWIANGTAALLGAAALVVGGVLGAWQWDRAHQQASAIEPDPPAPLADVMRPAESGRGEGRLVEVSGTWADAPVGFVSGKEVDGVDAVLLVMPLAVPADVTGIDQSATLPVLMGWLPAADAVVAPEGTPTQISGYVRGGEGYVAAPDLAPVDSAIWLGSMATAALAQEWPAPMYSYLVVADTPAPGWNPMPAPADRSRLDLRSLTYSAEWWLFGVFGAALAARWIRDNGRITAADKETE